MPSQKKSAIIKHTLSASRRAVLRRIKLVVLDVDGVMTDGRMVYGPDGSLFKVFDVYDGFGISRAIGLGLKIVILSRGISDASRIRGERLGIHKIYQNAQDKRKAFDAISKDFGVSLAETCFIGDDVYDLPLLDVVAFSVAPCSAYPPILKRVDFITTLPGGRGAVREVLDMILEVQGLL